MTFSSPCFSYKNPDEKLFCLEFSDYIQKQVFGVGSSTFLLILHSK